MTNKTESLLVEILAQVNRLHERLDTMDNTKTKPLVESIGISRTDVRVGSGSNQSKHDMVNLLSHYVSSVYDLVSLRTRNDIIWERLKAYDMSKLTVVDASIYTRDDEERGVTVYTIFTSRWYVEIEPISSGVNVLFNKFRKMDKNNIDDLRAVAQVVRTITKIING